MPSCQWDLLELDLDYFQYVFTKRASYALWLLYVYIYQKICYFLCDTYEMQRKTNLRKQPPRGVLSKRCSEDMRQIYNTHAEVWFE